MTTGLVVIDMQVGLFEGEPPCHDADGVVDRINALAVDTRAKGGSVFFVQHENDKSYAPGARLWQLLPTLDRQPEDVTVGKTACDCFYRSDLERRLRERWHRSASRDRLRDGIVCRHDDPRCREQGLRDRGCRRWAHDKGSACTQSDGHHRAPQLGVVDPSHPRALDQGRSDRGTPLEPVETAPSARTLLWHNASAGVRHDEPPVLSLRALP